MKKSAVLLGLILLLGTLANAQEQYGHVRGVIFDESGAPLPGVTVTLESELYGARSLQSSEAGIFRFLNLPVSKYRLKCELPGFKTHLQENIDVRIGVNVDLKVIMTPAKMEEEVTVVAVSPIVDMKKTGTVTQFTEVMLQKIPSARDPWVILQQAPGVLLDRENVGGSESGQQSGYISRGSMGWNTMWNMDGVPVTDMEAIGGSIGYYDFDTFEEIQIVTGGQDATLQTGGTAVNMITRRGGNQIQVLARTFFTNHDLQGDNRTQELKDLGYVGNRINRIMDYGLQLGGPILKDRFWFWLGYGVQDIRNITISDYPDNTRLENFNVKLNLQLSRKNRAELALLHPAKTKKGRGASPTNPPETTWDQKPLKFGLLAKFEDQHMFSNNFMLSLKLSYFSTGFALTPEGGMNVQPGLDLATGVWKGSMYYYDAYRPSYFGSLEGNAFKERFLGGSHEVKFGMEYRRTMAKSKVDWPGNAIKYYWDGEPLYAEVTRMGFYDYWSDRTSAYVNDTYTKGRLTFTAGLRMDLENGSNNDAHVSASEVAPDLLPAMTYPGINPRHQFLTFSPRLGFTFDLTGDGKTIIRGSAARYGSQEGLWVPNIVSTSSDAGAGYEWVDLNGDDKVTTDELTGYPLNGILWWWGFDPFNPGTLESINAIDPNLKCELSDELMVGMERELFADFSLSANLILRRNHRFMGSPYYDKATQTKITQADYVGPITGTLNYGGKSYPYEYWTLASYRPAGVIWENMPDYHENYTGLEATAVKRLSHKWMMNASFTYQTHNAHYGQRGYYDPTNIAALDNARANWVLNADWMAKLSFLYQLPWGFNISGFGNVRQGYLNLQSIKIQTPERGAVGLGDFLDIYVEKPGQTRLPTFYNLDVSLSKDFRLKKAGMVTLIVDAFNGFNFSHALSRFSQVNSTRHNEIQAILNPRIFRFGLRYSY